MLGNENVIGNFGFYGVAWFFWREGQDWGLNWFVVFI
jgi:hypothetical protein